MPRFPVRPLFRPLGSPAPLALMMLAGLGGCSADPRMASVFLPALPKNVPAVAQDVYQAALEGDEKRLTRIARTYEKKAGPAVAELRGLAEQMLVAGSLAAANAKAMADADADAPPPSSGKEPEPGEGRARSTEDQVADASAKAGRAITQASVIVAQVLPVAQTMITQLSVTDTDGFPTALPEFKAFLKALNPSFAKSK